MSYKAWGLKCIILGIFYVFLRTFNSRILGIFNSRILRTFCKSHILRTFNSRILGIFNSRILRTFNSRSYEHLIVAFYEH